MRITVLRARLSVDAWKNEFLDQRRGLLWYRDRARLNVSAREWPRYQIAQHPILALLPVYKDHPFQPNDVDCHRWSHIVYVIFAGNVGRQDAIFQQDGEYTITLPHLVGEVKSYLWFLSRRRSHTSAGGLLPASTTIVPSIPTKIPWGPAIHV